MDALEKRLARLRSFNAWVQGGDADLGEESADRGARALESMPAVPIEDRVALESIVLRRTRPVLAIRDNVTRLEFVDPADSEIWKARLEGARPFLDKAIRAVGRVNLSGADLDWVGTGWLIADNTLVTNRHVASLFVARDGQGFTFSMGRNGRIVADIDFLQEIDNLDALTFRLVRPLHVEDAGGPDIAFFEVEVMSGDARLAAPIALATRPRVTNNAATIGYPAYDSRILEPELMEEIYGKIYNKKRLAPGGVTRVEELRLLHNCTTLGGNSGSAVIDLDTGEALGLHFSGRFLDTNYAVRADVVKRVLDDVRAGRRASRTATRPETAPVAAAAPLRLTVPAGRGSVSMTVPLTITVSLGEPTTTASTRRRVAPAAPLDDGAIDGEEAPAADYRDREGYDAAFLGDGALAVALPTVDRHADDVLDFEVEGKTETVLRYDHYSVVMSRRRRMCFYSAVNIDGALSKKSKRVGWKWEPRIPKTQQIMNECYGNPPKKFSRGHMTRREDPGWGETLAAARRGNEDSMHVTNATPQMQAFNAPIWLELEDYALDHTKEDRMRVSVFTGPYFADDDPTMFGVRIPRAFWKIIAFIHDETGKLCATGYEMDQSESLPDSDEEFVFGPLTSSHLNVAVQVPIRSIEARSGLRFGRLAVVDPLAEAEEAIGEAARVPLVSLEQIRFVR